jgi:hypothetical protein
VRVGGNVLSTGKSSNSSSSSKAAAGFVSFVSVPLSVVVALVVGGAAPEAGAADIVKRAEVIEVVVAKSVAKNPMREHGGKTESSTVA